MKAPKKRGEGTQTRWTPLDAEWLEHQYVTLRKSPSKISEETSAGARTVKGWLARAGIPSRVWFKKSPSREWLYEQYVTQGRSVYALEGELKVDALTILKWLRKVEISIRGPKQALKERLKRHPPKSRVGQRRRMLESSVPFKCAWCSQLDSESACKGRLDLHHRDHTKDGKLENLQWLCYWCHKLEAALWNMRELGKIEVAPEGHTLHIRFIQVVA